MKSVSTHQAKMHLSRLISEVEEGGEIVICRGREPAAKLISAKEGAVDRVRPKVGTVTGGAVSWSEDCFEPLSEEVLKEWGVL
jgi:prevent-host-death family protein